MLFGFRGRRPRNQTTFATDGGPDRHVTEGGRAALGDQGDAVRALRRQDDVGERHGPAGREHLDRRAVGQDAQVEAVLHRFGGHLGLVHGREPGREPDVARPRPVDGQRAGRGVIGDAGARRAVGRPVDHHARPGGCARLDHDLDVGHRPGNVARQGLGGVVDLDRGPLVGRLGRLAGPGPLAGQDRLGHQARPAVDRAQGQAARGGHRPPPRLGGHLRGVRPVRHPGDGDPLVAGGLVPGAGGVEVGALVDPGARAELVGPEGGAVELSDDVPGARAAVLRPAVQVEDQHPTLVVAVEGQREQVGHLHQAPVDPEAADLRQGLPEQDAGPEQLDDPGVGHDRGHHPVAARLVPEHLGVAEAAGLGLVEAQHGVAQRSQVAPPSVE